jgi:hypothetical protein
MHVTTDMADGSCVDDPHVSPELITGDHLAWDTVSGSLGFVCHRQDHVPPLVSGVDVPVRLDDLLQGIAAVDDWS